MELRSDRLHVFDAVVRHGGFSSAARALGLTQSTVSQAIAALEADVGDLLFDRAGRQVTLTEAGRVLSAHAATVLRSLDDARSGLERQRDVTQGPLAVGTSDTLATWVLPPVFAALRREHPRVELRLDNRPSPAIAEAVAARQLDLGVVSLPLPIGVGAAVRALKQVPLMPQRDVVAVPKGHPLSRRTKVRAAELAGHPLVLLDRTTASRAWLDVQLEAARVQPKVVMEVSSVEVLKRLAALGFGATVVPEVALGGTRELVAVPLVGAHTRRMVGIVVGATPSRAARAFVDLAKQTLVR
ncbi:MAG: LysR family transcriptional regulator [Myxococcaceae bacterium]|nr:LysR family transcriptional regulator [Myxococcaceae bacterium]